MERASVDVSFVRITLAYVLFAKAKVIYWNLSRHTLLAMLCLVVIQTIITRQEGTPVAQKVLQKRNAPCVEVLGLEQIRLPIARTILVKTIHSTAQFADEHSLPTHTINQNAVSVAVLVLCRISGVTA